MSAVKKQTLNNHFQMLLLAAEAGDAKRIASHQAALLRHGVAVRIASEEE